MASKKDKPSKQVQLPLPELRVEDFAAPSFRVDDFIAKLAAPALERTAIPAKHGVQGAHPSLHDVKQLLAHFERCERELAKLQTQVDLKAERLKRELAQEEEAYQGEVSQLEVGWEAAQQSFADLENKMTTVTQAATKIGNRLQSAEQYRTRALDAIETLQHLQEFAHARDPSDLPQLFHQDARMAQAAAMAGKLLAVANELLRARERVGPAGEPPRAPLPRNAAPAPGSIEAAVEQLELYRNVLENRVVSRFDDALGRGELVTMADCANIMAQTAQGEVVLVQRYISTRPMFTNLRELQFGAGDPSKPPQQQEQQQEQLQPPSQLPQQPGGAIGQPAAVAAAAAAAGGGGAGSSGGREPDAACDQQAAAMAALRGLSSLYKGIVSTMREEAVVMEQVFPSPEAALSLYIQRIFEQRVGAALTAALRSPPRDAPPGAVGAHLTLLVEAFKKTRQLAADLQEACGCDVSGEVEAVFSDLLAGYPAPELRWLAALHEAKLKQRSVGSGGTGGGQQLSLQLVLDFLAMNEEAVGRCAVLSPPPQRAANVRQLFHGSTRKAANTGCLLEQVASHILLGLTAAVEGAAKNLLGPFQPAAVLQKAAAAGGAASSGSGGQPLAQQAVQQGRSRGQQAAPSAEPGPLATAVARQAGVGGPAGPKPGPLAAAAAAAAAAASTAAPATAQPNTTSRQASRASLQHAARLAVGSSLGSVLSAVSTVGAMAQALQGHYRRVILPHVEGSLQEARTCAAGLAALVKAADERVLAALQRTLTLLFNQIDLTLVAEQSRADFKPGEGEPPPSFDLPTPACTSVTALLAAAAELAEQHLHGPNLAAIQAELGRRLLRSLQVHMARFSYNPMGALRWKRDVAEYSSCCVSHLGLAPGGPVAAHFEELQNSINMLIVAPDSLLGLVDGNLRMPHAQALRVIALRDDFRSARVGDKSLSAVFAEP